MATAPKQRQPRLRASCDGCFLAKVKCSKARPICSRCLTCGIECRYSPSSRAGKPKASESAKSRRRSAATPPTGPPAVSGEGFTHAVSGIAAVYSLDAEWTSPPTSFDGALSRSQSISSGLTFMGVDDTSPVELSTGMSRDMYGSTMPWTPPNDMPSTFGDSPAGTTLRSSHSRSHSYEMNNNTLGWVNPGSPELFSFNQLPTPPTYFSSPTTTPNMRALPVRPNPTPPASNGGSCICFTVCLQSLQALHNASYPSPPPFDLVFSLNRKAIDGCAAMLGCTRCMRPSGTHTAAMLLATILGTITSFYKNASQPHFDQGNPMTNSSTETAMSPAPSSPNFTGIPGLGGVGLGAYTVVHGGDSEWRELEILGRELRRLDGVYSLFRDICSELSDDPEVSKAMIGYLGQSLGSTMQAVSHSKDGTGHH